jgi:hypothetical protein
MGLRTVKDIILFTAKAILGFCAIYSLIVIYLLAVQ